MFWSLSALGADVAFRHRLLYPNGSGPWGWVRVSVLSKGTLVLAVHRVTWSAKEAKARGRAVGRPLGWIAAIGRRLIMMVAKAHVANSTWFAPGVYLPDAGHVVIGAVEIGAGTIIHPRVTIGMGIVEGGRPRIGSRVWIGSDCVIYGPIVIGDGATILPGSVVTKHIPPGAVVSGNPPRLVANAFDNAALGVSLAPDQRLAAASLPPLPLA